MKNLIYGVTEQELSNVISGDYDVSFIDLSKSFTGSGHYLIELKIEVDGEDKTLSRTCTNMPLIDAWRDYVEVGECDEDYDNPILSAIEFVYDEENLD